MKQQFVTTRLGHVAVFQNEVESTETPLILLHGVYFDHHLWDKQLATIRDRKVIALDMPWHGASQQDVPDRWSLQDCAAIALKGKDDYVPTPPVLETRVVEGGHVSPLENPEAVLTFVQRVSRLVTRPVLTEK